MITEPLEIRRIKIDELKLLRDFLPIDWFIDIEKAYKQHYGHDYFYPVIAVFNHEIVGTGLAIINENAVWIGSIFVRDEHRKKGIGNRITNHLIDYSKAKGVDSIILTASSFGLSIYKKIGFEFDLNYLFFKTDNTIKPGTENMHISEINNADYDKIFKLDYAATGEKRIKLLTSCLQTGFKYTDNIIKGYYLPDFGSGLIIADSEEAGLALMQFRLSRDTSSICVPEPNLTAIDYLNSLGYYQFFKAPRLFLNNNVNWNSKCIYSRGSGYLG
jgi:GNAT superfamily N-acetyltransferase